MKRENPNRPICEKHEWYNPNDITRQCSNCGKIENDPLVELKKRQELLRKMDNKELLDRFSGVRGYQQIKIYKNEFGDEYNELLNDIGEYEDELLYRLNRQPNSFQIKRLLKYGQK